jgi:hypothetical protein
LIVAAPGQELDMGGGLPLGEGAHAVGDVVAEERLVVGGGAAAGLEANGGAGVDLEGGTEQAEVRSAVLVFVLRSIGELR